MWTVHVMTLRYNDAPAHRVHEVVAYRSVLSV